MENFNTMGHISPHGFDKLIHGDTTDLERLEFAEHLDFCESCFETYINTLDNVSLYPELPFDGTSLSGKIIQKRDFSKLRIYLSTGLAAAVAIVFINMCLFSPTFSKNLTEKAPLLKIPEFITNITESFENSLDKISDNTEIKFFKED